jgi:hypothetical protein
MKYKNIKNYTDAQFRRVTGVKRTTFEKMLAILHPKHEAKLLKGGRKPKLSLEEMLLAALEYWREYRTYAHIAASYGVHESNMQRTIKWIENILIQNGTFSLAGKKALLKSDVEYEVVLIDATETPVERPKKGSESGIPAKRSGTH